MQQTKALSDLSSNTNIVIKPFVKGGNIILLDRDDYKHIYLAKHYMVSTDWCKKYLFKILCAKTQNLIDQSTFELLNEPFPRTSTFYALPKIHENPIRPLGRLIHIGIDNLTSKVSIVVDDFLRSFVVKLPCYLKNTSHLFKILHHSVVPVGTLVVSIDVERRYYIILIPHKPVPLLTFSVSCA